MVNDPSGLLPSGVTNLDKCGRDVDPVASGADSKTDVVREDTSVPSNLLSTRDLLQLPASPTAVSPPAKKRAVSFDAEKLERALRNGREALGRGAPSRNTELYTKSTEVTPEYSGVRDLLEIPGEHNFLPSGQNPSSQKTLKRKLEEHETVRKEKRTRVGVDSSSQKNVEDYIEPETIAHRPSSEPADTAKAADWVGRVSPIVLIKSLLSCLFLFCT